MDGNRFDDLTRALAAGPTRRSLVRGIAGGVAGLLGLAGASRVAAGDDGDDDDDDCRRLGGRCQRDGHCCRGTVCEGGRCRLGCRIDGAFYPLGAARPGSPCQVCFPPTGTTRWTNRINGATCDDGNPCTGAGSCRTGACVAGPDVVTPTCAPLDRCHVAGVCDPATGGCTTPTAPNGTGCDDGDPCTTNDTCQDGVCRGTAVDCSGLTTACALGVCANGTCATQPRNEGDVCPGTGEACSASACRNGVCATTSPAPCAAGTVRNPTTCSCDPVTCVGATNGSACAGGYCVQQACCPAAQTCDGVACCPDPAKPCCASSGGACCFDCFSGDPDGGGGRFCCPAEDICGDYPNDECCINGGVCVPELGRCCYGPQACDGLCCSTACCGFGANRHCCGDRQECSNGTCVDSGRACAGDPECFANESCVNGSCCPADRIWPGSGDGTTSARPTVCCTVGTSYNVSGDQCCDDARGCQGSFRITRPR